MSMKSPFRILCCLVLAMVLAVPSLAGAEKKELVFGAIAVGKVSKTKNSLQPLFDYLNAKTGYSFKFMTGKDYADTIDKFRSGAFDLGFIGPSPYVIASSQDKGNLKIMAGLETNGKPFFHAVIIAAKNNAAINSLQDLKGKKFGFGSRQSTLSCYMPCKMLMDAGVFDELAGYEFLGKHDKVARNVAMGGIDAGGIKEAVADANLDKLKIIATSVPVYDFLFVAHKTMPASQFEAIRTAMLELKDPKVLGSIKKGVTGIIPTKDSNYDSLREVMAAVDAKLGK